MEVYRLQESTRKLFEDALISAFPTRDTLARLVTSIFGRELDQIAIASDLVEITHHLVRWAETHSQLERLVLGALHMRQLDEKLRTLSTLVDWEAIDSWDPNAELPICPYVGLAPFGPSDEDYFYGREAEITQMLLRLDASNYFFVVGPSGSGKTSFISAGLLPRLNKEQPDQWLVLNIKPDVSPLLTLKQTLALPEASTDLTTCVSRMLSSYEYPKRLLLVIDPFEGLFRVSDRTEQLQYMNILKELKSIKECTLIIVMRGDFFYSDELMRSPLWPVDQSERVELSPLVDIQLRRAIVEPATRVEVSINADLVERLLADADKAPGAMPLLQETMRLLWPKMHSRTISLAAYEEMGTPATMGTSASSGLSVALSNSADAVMRDEMTAEQRDVAQRIFLRLIQFGEGRPDTRRRQSVKDLQSGEANLDLFHESLSILSRRRLVITSGGEGNGSAYVDLSHDALITAWPALRRWVEERKALELVRRRLVDRVTVWRRSDQSADALLSEAELRDAEGALQHPFAQDVGFEPYISALVTASRAAIAQLAREKQEAHQWEIHQASRIFAPRLAAWSRFKLPLDPELSLRLALEAVLITEGLTTEPTPTAIESLYHALQPGFSELSAEGHKSPVRAAVYSPDSRSILTCSEDRTVRILDAGTLKLIVCLPTHEDTVFHVAWHPTGAELLTVTRHSIRIFNSDGSERYSGVQPRLEQVRSASYSPDGQRIIATTYDGVIKIWDLQKDAITAIVDENIHFVKALYSPDGTRFLAAGTNGVLVIYDALAGKKWLDWDGHKDRILDIAWSPNGRFVASASEDKTAVIWEANTGDIHQPLRNHTDWVRSIAWSPDNESILTACGNTLWVWDINSGQLLHSYEGHVDWVYSGTWSPDGSRIVSAGRDCTARIWDTRSERMLSSVGGAIIQIAFGPSNAEIATAGQDGLIRIWDLHDYGMSRCLIGHRGRVNSLAYDSSGLLLASGSDDYTVRVWNVRADGQMQQLGAQSSPVIAVAWSRDGQVIASGHDGKIVNIWRVSKPDVPLSFRATNLGKIMCIDCSPDSSLVLTGGSDGYVRLWSVKDGAACGALSTGAPVCTAKWSPDGERIFTIGTDGRGQVWSARTLHEINVQVLHGNAVSSAAWSPDGSRIVTAGREGSIYIWDSATGRLLWTPSRSGPSILNVAWGIDGRIAIAMVDGKVNLCIVGEEELLSAALASIPTRLSREERSRYLEEDPLDNT